MRSLTRFVLAGALVGSALLVPPAQAAVRECWDEPCYQCFMYPCGPRDWVEFICKDKLAVCS